MNDDMNRPELDDILFEFVGSTDLPNWKTVQEWMDRYPRFAREIADFAAAWILSETMPEHPETMAIPEERWREIGMRAFERAVAESRAEYAAAPPLTSLVAAAKEQGIDLAALARQTRTSEQFVMKLDRRLIEASEIPGRLVREIAQTLQTTADRIAAYFAQPARLARGGQYRAEQTPAVQKKESFAEAVKNDRDLKPEDRARLLAMREDGDDAT